MCTQPATVQTRAPYLRDTLSVCTALDFPALNKQSADSPGKQTAAPRRHLYCTVTSQLFRLCLFSDYIASLSRCSSERVSVKWRVSKLRTRNVLNL